MNRSANSCSLLLILVALVGCEKPAPITKTAPLSEPSEEKVMPVSDATAEAAKTSEVEATLESAPLEKESDGELGQLKVRFLYDGNPIEPKSIKVTTDKEFCGKKELVNERLLVNPDNQGIRNVIVCVDTGRGGAKLPPSKHTPQDIVLKNEFCRFEPHIVLARNGDTLRVENPDDVGHNANISFFNQPAVNLMIPPKLFKTVDLVAAQPAPIPIDCNIHPWMKAYVMVLDHPFVAVSDENGELMIEGLPVRQKLIFRAYHEAGSLSEVVINGKTESWNRSRFEVEINAGMNDMGTVKVPADALSAE